VSFTHSASTTILSFTEFDDIHYLIVFFLCSRVSIMHRFVNLYHKLCVVSKSKLEVGGGGIQK